jgi:hypothetical protein
MDNHSKGRMHKRNVPVTHRACGFSGAKQLVEVIASRAVFVVVNPIMHTSHQRIVPSSLRFGVRPLMSTSAPRMRMRRGCMEQQHGLHPQQEQAQFPVHSDSDHRVARYANQQSIFAVIHPLNPIL